MKAWLKGGLWGAGVSFVLVILLNFSPYIPDFPKGDKSLRAVVMLFSLFTFSFLAIPLAFLDTLISRLFGTKIFFEGSVFLIFPTLVGSVFFIILYGLIGSLIGWRVGIWRSNKKQKDFKKRNKNKK